MITTTTHPYNAQYLDVFKDDTFIGTVMRWRYDITERWRWEAYEESFTPLGTYRTRKQAIEAVTEQAS